MIFYSQPTDPWTPFDFKLLEAYQRLQDEICPRCGNPVWLCRSNDERVDFKVKTGICYAEKALKEREVRGIADKKQRDEAKKNLKNAGEILYTIPYNPPNIGGGLPTRKDYYDSLKPDAVE